jgi:ComF family protein
MVADKTGETPGHRQPSRQGIVYPVCRYNPPVLLLGRIIRDVIDLCYPGLCAVCRAACDSGSFLCDHCDQELRELQRRPACNLCGAPLATDAAPCPFCKGRGVRHYGRVLRLGTFNEPLKGLIHRMKYNRQWTLAEHLGRRLLAHDGVGKVLDRAHVLVPVPLHLIRQFGRGFNQAEVIARQISRDCGKPVVRAVRRVRHTPSQTRLTIQMRRDNVRNAFKLIHPGAIRGKHVVVIDDVMTTGATLQTVAGTLRAGRPASLSAIVLAVADPKSRDFRAI